MKKIESLKSSKKILIGLSGGIDSAVSAAILTHLGHEVIACTLKMFDSDSTSNAIHSAQKIAKLLNIKHIVIDVSAAFSQHVSNYFFRYYKSGRTPNPCIMCNQFVKFFFLNTTRKDVNADFLATGHYSKLDIVDDEIFLSQGSDLKKDQSYFLYRVDREILKKTIFPLSDFKKSEVRLLAKEFNIHIQNAESHDICFIDTKNYTSFLEEYGGKKNVPGSIFDVKGNFLGHHLGTEKYTIGQRKGLGLAGGPYFVKSIDYKKNMLIVADKHSLKSEIVRITNVVFLNKPFLGDCLVKFRSSGLKIKSKLCEDVNGFFIKLLEPEFALAPGQHAVFYNDTKLLGGGEIMSQNEDFL